MTVGEADSDGRGVGTEGEGSGYGDGGGAVSDKENQIKQQRNQKSQLCSDSDSGIRLTGEINAPLVRRFFSSKLTTAAACLGCMVQPKIVKI